MVGEIYVNAATVTPDDNTDLASNARALIAAVAGVASVVTNGNQTVLLPLAAGIPVAIRVRRVRATGTTATGIIALF